MLGTTFERAGADDSVGAALHAAGLSERLRLSDLDLVVDLAAGASDGCYLDWGFDEDPDFEPRLTMSMDSAVANAILQGSESIAVAIARRRIRVKGEARAALAHLPAMRQLQGTYLGVIEELYPHLLASGRCRSDARAAALTRQRTNG